MVLFVDFMFPKSFIELWEQILIEESIAWVKYFYTEKYEWKEEHSISLFLRVGEEPGQLEGDTLDPGQAFAPPALSTRKTLKEKTIGLSIYRSRNII